MRQIISWSAVSVVGVGLFGSWLKSLWVAPKIPPDRNEEYLVDALVFSSFKVSQLLFNRNHMVALATKKLHNSSSSFVK